MADKMKSLQEIRKDNPSPLLEGVKRETAADSEKQRYEKGLFGKNDSKLLRARLDQRYKKRG